MDGPLPSLCKIFVLFSPLFRSYPIKAVQKLIVCIFPVQVLLALFHTLVNTGGYVATSSTALQSTRSTHLWVQCTNSKPLNNCCHPLRWVESECSRVAIFRTRTIVILVTIIKHNKRVHVVVIHFYSAGFCFHFIFTAIFTDFHFYSSTI